MRHFSCIVFLLTIFAATTYAATARGYYNDPKNPGKCTITENLVLSPGEKIKNPLMDCGRIMCGQDGFVIFHTCGVRVVVGCRMGDYIDKSLPYPDCCKRHVICD